MLTRGDGVDSYVNLLVVELEGHLARKVQQGSLAGL